MFIWKLNLFHQILFVRFFHITSDICGRFEMSTFLKAFPTLSPTLQWGQQWLALTNTCSGRLATSTFAFFEWVKRPGWAWVRMRDHVDDSWWAASNPDSMRPVPHKGTQTRPQNCPAEPDWNADPQNKFIPFPHTHIPGSGDDHHHVPLLSTALNTLHSDAIFAHLPFLWFSGLMLTWPLLSGHSPACRLPL